MGPRQSCWQVLRASGQTNLLFILLSLLETDLKFLSRVLSSWGLGIPQGTRPSGPPSLGGDVPFDFAAQAVPTLPRGPPSFTPTLLPGTPVPSSIRPRPGAHAGQPDTSFAQG